MGCCAPDVPFGIYVAAGHFHFACSTFVRARTHVGHVGEGLDSAAAAGESAICSTIGPWKSLV